MSGEESGYLTDEFTARECVVPLVVVCHVWDGNLDGYVAAAGVDFDNPTFVGSGERSSEKKQHSIFPSGNGKHTLQKQKVKNEILNIQKSLIFLKRKSLWGYLQMFLLTYNRQIIAKIKPIGISESPPTDNLLGYFPIGGPNRKFFASSDLLAVDAVGTEGILCNFFTSLLFLLL